MPVYHLVSEKPKKLKKSDKQKEIALLRENYQIPDWVEEEDKKEKAKKQKRGNKEKTKKGKEKKKSVKKETKITEISAQQNLSSSPADIITDSAIIPPFDQFHAVQGD